MLPVNRLAVGRCSLNGLSLPAGESLPAGCSEADQLESSYWMGVERLKEGWHLILEVVFFKDQEKEHFLLN